MNSWSMLFDEIGEINFDEPEDPTVYPDTMNQTTKDETFWRYDEGKILLGLEFSDVRHNAEKLWLQRHYYRKSLVVDASILLNEHEIAAQTIDISKDGMRLSTAAEIELNIGDAIKVFVPERKLKALAVVIWLNQSPDSTEFGVRYIDVR